MKNQLIKEKQNMTYLSWAKIRNSSGTAGSFLKSYSTAGDKKIYYKLSDYDPVNGIVGHECVNELIADRLLSILGIEHLSYTLVHAEVNINGKTNETYLCASEDFKEKGESKIALDAYYEAEKTENESLMEFCIRNGWENYVKENLELIPKNKLPRLNALKQSDREIVMADLDGIISKNLMDKIWDMIYNRWCYYEDFCNKK